MTFGSLFAGIGGLDLGLERAGMTCRWQVEVDPFCCAVLATHWPDVPKFGDVRDLTGEELERVDLIAGGFPCQPVSVAGRRRGQADPRWLWPEFARVIRVVRPRYVLVENVPNLLSVNRGDAMGEVLGGLADIGYDAEWDCIPAAAVGAPHLRYRVFLVGYPNRQRREGRHPPGQQAQAGPAPGHGALADADCGGLAAGRELRPRGEQPDSWAGSAAVADAQGVGGPLWAPAQQRPGGPAGFGGDVADAQEQPERPGLCPGEASEIWRGRLGHSRGTDDVADADRQPAVWASEPWAERHPGATEPGMGGSPDGLPTGMDGHRWPAPPGPEQYPWEPPRLVSGRQPRRRHRLSALGNAVVPQVAQWIGERIMAVEADRHD